MSRLKVIVKTNARKTEILGFDETRQALKVAVSAPPRDNEANIELLKFLKKNLKREVKLISGFKNKEKILEI